MSTNDITAAAALLRLDDAIKAVYNALLAIGLGADPTREAIRAQVDEMITTAIHDSAPLPADTDEDGGTGGVHIIAGVDT